MNSYNQRMLKLLKFFWNIPAFFLIGLVRVYQICISPLIKACCGDVCRFEPSCSQYFIDAVKKYGAVKGACKGIWRLLRCAPWGKGGHDPP